MERKISKAIATASLVNDLCFVFTLSMEIASLNSSFLIVPLSCDVHGQYVWRPFLPVRSAMLDRFQVGLRSLHGWPYMATILLARLSHFRCRLPGVPFVHSTM